MSPSWFCTLAAALLLLANAAQAQPQSQPASRLDDFGHDAFDFPYPRDGKPSITRCENQARFRTISEIDWVLAALVDQWFNQAIASGALQEAVDRWFAFPWGLERLRQLIDARLLLASDVARAKWNANGAIEDLPREQRIIQGLGQQAAALGVPSNWAESFFRAQIEASKTVQRERFAQWRKTKAGRFEGAPDLARDLRPALDALTPKLLSALAENAKVLRDPARRADVARALGALDAAALSPAAARQAVSVLTNPPGQ